LSKTITDFYISIGTTIRSDPSWLYEEDIYGLKIELIDDLFPNDIKVNRVSTEKVTTGYMYSFSTTMDVYTNFVLFFPGYTVVDIFDESISFYIPK
jgi:hypothetical protein